jgi:LuxR family maltose regulon positive regulatory protein
MEGEAPRAASPVSSSLVEPLSQRELDVLRLFRTELSGPEIARELVIGLSTVRTHTKSIYSKLNVNSRRAAVKRAEELGLI